MRNYGNIIVEKQHTSLKYSYQINNNLIFALT